MQFARIIQQPATGLRSHWSGDGKLWYIWIDLKLTKAKSDGEADKDYCRKMNDTTKLPEKMNLLSKLMHRLYGHGRSDLNGSTANTHGANGITFHQ